MNANNQYRQNNKVRGSVYGRAYSAPIKPEFHSKMKPTAKIQVGDCKGIPFMCCPCKTLDIFLCVFNAGLCSAGACKQDKGIALF
jgi:hypothetical protein